MQQRKAGREDGLGRLKERLRRLESKRYGAVRTSLALIILTLFFVKGTVRRYHR